jgi:eukaryotic-like serine/threonine-protein kinase
VVPDTDPIDGDLLAAQRERWARGERITVEQFIAQQPELRNESDALLDLIYGEFVLRRNEGERPAVAEFVGRFPKLADAIRMQFEVDDAFGGEATNAGARSISTEPKSGPTASITAPPGYEILEILGRGGMGVVYKARQIALDRLVALKMIRSGELADPAERARFEAEARAIARLSHPNVVQIYEVGEANGQPFLALEYVAGGNLAAALRGPPFAPSAAAALIATLARAIQHAHAAGVIHRDLKPANVLLVRGEDVKVVASDSSKSAKPASSRTTIDQPKLTDFGLAKLGGGSDLTRTGDALGTPSYMAPEQTGGPASAIGPAADVYGLGAILYETLTGRPPFQAESALAIVLRVQTVDPVPPRRLQPTVPRDLETICLKCLRKDPRHRYASADALADDLQRYLDGKPILARPVGMLGHVAKWARRHPATAGLLSACALAAAVLLAVLVASDVRIRQKQWETENALRAEKEARTDLTRTLERERSTLYLQSIRLAQAAILASNVRQAERDLDACLPESGQRDLRGWEWHYLKRLCHAELCIFREHGDVVNGVAFSADGERVASISRDQTLKVWDASNGRVLFSVPVPHSNVQFTYLKCCFGPNGKLLAMGDSTRNLVTVHDAENGRELHTFAGFAPIFSPDGERLAAIDVSLKQVRIYKVSSGAELRSCPFPGYQVFSFAFQPDGLWAAAVRPDRTIRVWNVETDEAKFTLRGQTTGNFKAVFSPDGRRIASAGVDGTIKLWDATDGKDLGAINAHPAGNITCLVFSADGQRLASGDFGGSLKVWDTKTQDIQTLPGHGAHVVEVAFGPGGRLLASASTDRTIKIWDTNKDPNAVILRGHKSFVLGLGFSPDGRRLASVGFDGFVKVWDPVTGKIVLNSPARMGNLCHVQFSPEGNRLAICNMDTAVKIWDAASGKELNSFQGRNGSRVVVVSPSGTFVASAVTKDSEIKIWDVTTGQLVSTLRGHTGGVLSLAFSPDSQQLASTSQDTTVKVWETATGREIHTLRGNSSPVKCAAFSADGRFLASDGNEVIRLWDLQTGAEVLAMRNAWGRNTVLALAFSPDGRRLASGGNHAIVTLWDTQTGQEVVELPTSRMIVTTVLFSPDGRQLAAVTNDGAITVWDAPNADEADVRKPDQ